MHVYAAMRTIRCLALVPKPSLSKIASGREDIYEMRMISNIYREQKIQMMSPK